MAVTFSILHIRKSHPAHKFHGSIFYSLLLIEVLHCGNEDFQALIAHVTLILSVTLVLT